MHFDPAHHRTVMNFIGYFAGQAKAIKTMADDKRSYYDLSISLLAVDGIFKKLFTYFYFMLHDEIIDRTNPLLDHPELEEKTRSKVHEIRISAGDMDIVTLVKTIDELERISKLLP